MVSINKIHSSHYATGAMTLMFSTVVLSMVFLVSVDDTEEMKPEEYHATDSRMHDGAQLLSEIRHRGDVKVFQCYLGLLRFAANNREHMPLLHHEESVDERYKIAEHLGKE